MTGDWATPQEILSIELASFRQREAAPTTQSAQSPILTVRIEGCEKGHS
jgi:hypothetical protein